MPNSQQAKVIASHKFGRRKLTSLGALARINKLDTVAANFPLIATIKGDAQVVALITALNTSLKAFFTAIGINITTGENEQIGFGTGNDLSIPQNLWLGKIKFPYGAGVTDAQKDTADAARATFSDSAGKLRARIAQLYAIAGVLYDLANSPDHPNVGGVVVGVKHTPANQA